MKILLELTNHADVSTRAERLHECLCARLCNSTEIVHQVRLGHTHTRITDGERTLLLVGSDADVELLLSVELRRVGKGRVADLVKRIGRVRD